jgi:hypothetical protein
MIIVSYEPQYLFISTGELTAMYTARSWGLFEAVNSEGNEIAFEGSNYIQNLSVDWLEAKRKLHEMAFDMELPVVTQEEAFPLNTIKDREASGKSAAMVEQIERAKQEQLERDLARVAEYITKGVLLAGKWRGVPVELVDADYVNKLASMAEMLSENDISAWATTLRICKAYAETLSKSEWVGNVGETVTGVMRIVSTKWLQNSQYPTCMIKAVMQEGGYKNKVVLYTTRKAMVNAVAGETFNIKATVTRCDESSYEPSCNNKVSVLKLCK